MRRISHSLTLAAAAASLVAFAHTARAQQNPGFAVNKFDPSEKGSDWFVNESLDFRGKLRPALGIVGDLSTNPVVFYLPDGSTQGSLVSSQLYAHLGASLTLVDRIRVGVSLPLALYQNGESLTRVDGTQLTPPSKAALGDVRVGADLRLIGEYKGAFTAAVGAQAHLPSGAQGQFTGDGSARIVPRLMLAGDISDFAYAVRIGYEVRGRTDAFTDVAFGDEVTGGIAVGLRAFDRKLIIGPELYGSTLAAHAFHSRTSPAELLFGGHYSWDDFRLGAGIGTGLSTAFGSPGTRILLGLEWSPAIAEPKPADRDGDGIDDAHDACPDQAGVKTDDPKTNGCPPPPPVVAPSDKDGDGIADADDACPEQAGVKTDDPKTNGCPPPPPDKDKDGIADADDACPDQPGVKTEDPKTNGCPALAVIEQGQIKITEQVKFKTNSAEILPESDAVLSAVLGILKGHPEIAKVHIEGHTDNKGTAALNRTLSGKRAASVAAWLQLKGIDKARLDSKGFGPDRPIDTNATDAGRQNNRRVEFHIEEAAK